LPSSWGSRFALPGTQFAERTTGKNALVEAVGKLRLGDLDGDGFVGINDFLTLLGGWEACR